MNDWNQLENRLRSWNPRRPSRALKQRLFGDSHAGRRTAAGGSETRLDSLLAALRVSNWLAPATVLCALALVLMNQGSPGLELISPSSGLVASYVVKHPNLAAFYESQRHSGHNAWREATFEWTNGSQSLSNLGSTWEVWATNQLFR